MTIIKFILSKMKQNVEAFFCLMFGLFLFIGYLALATVTLSLPQWGLFLLVVIFVVSTVVCIITTCMMIVTLIKELVALLKTVFIRWKDEYEYFKSKQ